MTELNIAKTDEIGPYTYRDYKKLPEGSRVELHNGYFYNMADANEFHFDIQGSVFEQFRVYLKDKSCKVYSERSVRLWYTEDESDKKTYRPDISVVCDKTKIHNHFIAGAPDLIIEIWSPSTGSVDLVEKRHAYESGGVKEYWVIDSIRRVYQYLLDELGIYRETVHPSFKGEDIEIPVKIWDGRFSIKLGTFVHQIGDINP